MVFPRVFPRRFFREKHGPGADFAELGRHGVLFRDPPSVEWDRRFAPRGALSSRSRGETEPLSERARPRAVLKELPGFLDEQALDGDQMADKLARRPAASPGQVFQVGGGQESRSA